MPAEAGTGKCAVYSTDLHHLGSGKLPPLRAPLSSNSESETRHGARCSWPRPRARARLAGQRRCSGGPRLLLSCNLQSFASLSRGGRQNSIWAGSGHGVWRQLHHSCALSCPLVLGAKAFRACLLPMGWAWSSGTNREKGEAAIDNTSELERQGFEEADVPGSSAGQAEAVHVTDEEVKKQEALAACVTEHGERPARKGPADNLRPLHGHFFLQVKFHQD